MRRSPTWLLEFKDDIYSQTGEDGIIREILRHLPEKDFWCVEFGAWDGMHLSNTRNLIESQDYSAVLIEGNSQRCEDLRKNYSSNKNVIPINSFVGFEGPNTLDKVLSKTDIPTNFDFLSIDIDGNDYHVWDAMSKYQPKLVCIEYNPTIPNEVDFVQQRDASVSQGTSLSAMVKLAKEKGYELLAALQFNAFFVKEEYFSLFGIENNSIESLRVDMSTITYLFSGYDGKVFLHGYKELPWHAIALQENKFQPIPKALRKHPYSYGRLGRMAIKFLRRTSRGFRRRAA